MSDPASAQGPDAEMRDAAAAAGDEDGSEDDAEEEEEEEEDDEEEELPPAEEPPSPAAPEPVSAFPGNPNQLTLLFQGEVYVFESVTPDKVSSPLALCSFMLHGSENLTRPS